MKKIIFILSSCFMMNSFGAPCEGAPGTIHMNPDGSTGGFIQKGVQISRDAYISSDSEVCGKAKIVGTARIISGSRLDGDVIIEGNPKIVGSHIYGSAKISGGAIVQSSEVCQASLIEGIRVIDSDYYCQTEDPQPKDPGEEGRKTLLGVDSDGDGVRDDIEVFINNSLSNTVSKNFSQERIVTKLYAQILQKEILLRSDQNKIRSLLQEKIDLNNCFDMSIKQDVFIHMYDTKERVYSLFKVIGYVHGETIKEPSAKCKSLSSFHDHINKL